MLLFANHVAKQCGVFRYGKRIASILQSNFHDNILYREYSDSARFVEDVKMSDVEIVVVNYHVDVTNYIDTETLERAKATKPIVNIYHEGPNLQFNMTFDVDPNTAYSNMIGLPRALPVWSRKGERPEEFIIGSFGYATSLKRFDLVISKAAEQCPGKRVRIHMPRPDVTPFDVYDSMVNNCLEIANKLGVPLEVSTNEFTDEELLYWLSRNSINVFIYDEIGIRRGPSSSLDFALAVGRPIAVNNNQMFRLFTDVNPSIFVEEHSLYEIAERGDRQMECYLLQWSHASLCHTFIETLKDRLHYIPTV
jgi:hypothetical protein